MATGKQATRDQTVTEVSVSYNRNGGILRICGETFQLPKGVRIRKQVLEGEIRGFRFAMELLNREINEPNGKKPREAIEERMASSPTGVTIAVPNKEELFSMAYHCGIEPRNEE
jgi:hypothetical protein